MGIEPTLSAWEAEVLPLNYTRRGVPILATSSRALKPVVAPAIIQGPARNGVLAPGAVWVAPEQPVLDNALATKDCE